MTAVETMTDQATVLVVEDDQEINELLGEYLSLEHVRYVQALTGKAGLEHVAGTAGPRPDVVVLDLMLPDIDGYEVARQITTHHATFDIPVILLTCMNQDCDRLKGFASGALQYMNKPFLPDDLIDAVRSALAWRRNLRSRPPAGTIYVSTANPIQPMQQLNNMTADLFARTSISDAAMANIREAFDCLTNWAAEWGKANKQDPKLSIDYKILAGEALANGTPATSVEWTLSEATPGLLAAAFFKPSSGNGDSGGFSITGTLARAFGLGVDRGAATADKCNPDAAGTGANWFAFLGKTGAATFDRDTAKQTVRLVRILNADAGVPVVSADGARKFPHRVRGETITARKQS